MDKVELFHNEIMAMAEEYRPTKVAHIFEPFESSQDGQNRAYYNEYVRIKDGKYIYDYPCWFYWYLACMIKKLKPMQVVELGADRGASAIFMASELPEGGKVYSVDIRASAWEYVREDMDNIIKVVGDSKVREIWPDDVSLDETKFWLIDGDHSVEQVRAECKLYSQYWQEGTVVLFDDLGQVLRAFEELKYEKFIIPRRTIHGTRVGLLIV
jgi:cephalosporin hydroxylase